MYICFFIHIWYMIGHIRRDLALFFGNLEWCSIKYHELLHWQKCLSSINEVFLFLLCISKVRIIEIDAYCCFKSQFLRNLLIGHLSVWSFIIDLSWAKTAFCCLIIWSDNFAPWIYPSNKFLRKLHSMMNFFVSNVSFKCMCSYWFDFSFWIFKCSR